MAYLVITIFISYSYVKIRGANQVGAVPPNYRCYKCHQGGHWIKDCTFGQGPVSKTLLVIFISSKRVKSSTTLI